MWHSSHGNLGLTFPVSPSTENLQNVHVPPFDALPLSSACMLLSLCGFPLQVSRCSEGFTLNLPCL